MRWISFFLLLMAQMYGTYVMANDQPSSIPAVIERIQYFPVLPLTRNIKLGGLLLPGHEQSGTTQDAAIRQLLQLGLPNNSTIQLEVPLVLDDAKLLIGPSGKTLEGCIDMKVSVVGFTVHKLQTTAAMLSPKAGLRHTIANAIGVNNTDLEGYVVVTSTLEPVIRVAGCADDTTRDNITKAFAGTVIGYQAGIDVKAYAGVGVVDSFKLLKTFELREIAADRTLKIQSLASNPSPVDNLGYADVVRFGHENPEDAADSFFDWIGPTPTGKLELFPGRFYFRLKKGGHSVTVLRNLTLSDADQTIRLVVTEKTESK